MKCRECVHARKFSADGIYCVQYGMIIRDGHECTLPGAIKKRRSSGAANTGGEDWRPTR